MSGDGTALYCKAVAVCHSGLSTVVFLMPSANQISFATAINFKSICKVVVFYKKVKRKKLHKTVEFDKSNKEANNRI